MRAAAVVLAWAVAVVVVMAAGFSAALGRANWGDGRGPSVSLAGVAGLVAIAVLAVAAAVWISRRLGPRRGG